MPFLLRCWLITSIGEDPTLLGSHLEIFLDIEAEYLIKMISPVTLCVTGLIILCRSGYWVIWVIIK
ncbi:hypothetical protein HMPREF2836_00250 [Rothia sp. HMSC065C12]|nr:hypothetical protein HMPREF2845_06425 [Rothia sp. HMSC065B04]OFJ97738.1 hypothetical protein HMPREF2836_00250 [Rothia sp. HMSC065C12]